MTARSCAVSTPRTVPWSEAWPSLKTTFTLEAPETTCAFVRITPSFEMTTPEPSAFADWLPQNGSHATWVTGTFTTDGRARVITAAPEETGAGRALSVRDRAAAR